MNIRNFQEFNRFKKMINSKDGDPQEIEVFHDIKEAESMSVEDLLKFGKRFVLIGIMDDLVYTRPIVYNRKDGYLYPKADKFAIFPQLSLLQDIPELQEIIDEVPVPCFETGAIVRPFDDMELVNVEVVYGHESAQKTPHLTLAEIVSQLAKRYDDPKEVYFFYVCDSAEDCGNLTEIGYHAYKVAVYGTTNLTDDMIPDIMV